MPNINCIIHGSFGKHLDLMEEIAAYFGKNGINVVAPKFSKVTGKTGGFIHLRTDVSQDPIQQELEYLNAIPRLGAHGFSYYVNPEGILGNSTSYELPFEQMMYIRTIFMKPLKDPPAYIPQNSVWSPESLVKHVKAYHNYPPPIIDASEGNVANMLVNLRMPGLNISIGGLIFYGPEILLVKTQKWGGLYSTLGEKIKPCESINNTLEKCIYDQIGISDVIINRDICSFDELPTQYSKKRIFIDKMVTIPKQKKLQVKLNTKENESYISIKPIDALNELSLEPNARKTIETYAQVQELMQ